MSTSDSMKENSSGTSVLSESDTFSSCRMNSRTSRNFTALAASASTSASCASSTARFLLLVFHLSSGTVSRSSKSLRLTFSTEAAVPHGRADQVRDCSRAAIAVIDVDRAQPPDRGSRSRRATPASVPMKVESICSQSRRSTTKSLYPRWIICFTNSLRPALFWKVPRPSTFTQTARSTQPTWTEDVVFTLVRETTPA